MKPYNIDKIPWSTKEDRDRLAIELYTNKKLGTGLVGRALGISKRTVFAILKRNNIETDRHRLTPYKADIRRADVIKKYTDGMSLSEIAAEYNVDPETIRLRLADVPRRTPADTNSSIPFKLIPRVLEWYDDGCSSYEISGMLMDAYNLQVHPNSIQNLLNRKGVIRSHEDARKLATEKFAKRLYRSKPEKVVEQYLAELHIPAESQFVLDGWAFDFRHNNILIEVQGDYWHKLPDRIARDSKKSKVAADHGYRLIYIWEHELVRPDLVKARLANAIHPPATFDFTQCSCSELDYKTAKEFLDKYHYQCAGRGGYAIGAYFGGVLVGVVVYCPPVRQEIAKRQGVAYSEIWELSRLCINPDFQCKNFATWLIARSRRMFRAGHEGVKLLVSFADTTYGHNGTIYRADNWKLDGEVVSGYWYVDAKRSIIHKKSVWNKAKRNGVTEREQAAADGLLKVKGRPKLRFIHPA